MKNIIRTLEKQWDALEQIEDLPKHEDFYYEIQDAKDSITEAIEKLRKAEYNR